jgi:small subunit ribosomal protein S13
MLKFFKEKSLISGVNKDIFLQFNKKSGLNNRIDYSFIKRKHVYRFSKIVSKIYTEKRLKERVQNNISFLYNIKSYKGNRHKLKYPTRGQRTHTNAKTRKK